MNLGMLKTNHKRMKRGTFFEVLILIFTLFTLHTVCTLGKIGKHSGLVDRYFLLEWYAQKGIAEFF
jgi:hypothetical protein